MWESRMPMASWSSTPESHRQLRETGWMYCPCQVRLLPLKNEKAINLKKKITTEEKKTLSHYDSAGRVRMVDVSAKPETHRQAVASVAKAPWISATCPRMALFSPTKEATKGERGWL